jgi:hypothetical protein
VANNRNLDRVSGRIDKRGQGSDACTDGNAASGIQEPHKKIGSGGETKNNSSVAANNLFLSLAAQRKSSQSPPHGLAQAPPQDTVGDGRPDDISTSDIHTPRRQLGLLRYLFRVAFFIIMPPIYAVMCVFWHHYEMMVVFVFVLCFYGLLGKIDYDAKWITWLQKVPVLGRALFSASALSDFYEQHPPAPFAYYFFYPLTCLFGAVHSSVRRRELFLYCQIIGVFVLVIAGKQVFEFGSVYLPYLGVVDVFYFLTKISILMVLTTVVFLVPMITTSFELRMTGQTQKLRYIALSGLVVSVPVFLLGFVSETVFPTSASLPADVLLDLRFHRTEFRSDLSTISRMFLEYHIDEAKELPVLGQVSENPLLTPRYQKVIRNVVVQDERLAFYVFNLPGQDGKTWLAIGRGLYPDEARKHLLFICSPDHQFHTVWPEQAEHIQNFVHDVSHRPWEDITFREQHVRNFPNLHVVDSRLSATAPAKNEILTPASSGVAKQGTNGGEPIGNSKAKTAAANATKPKSARH